MKSHYRKATAEEIKFYKAKLYPLQDNILSLCSQYYENLLTINAHGISGKALIMKNIDEKKLLNFIEELKGKVEEEIKKKKP